MRGGFDFGHISALRCDIRMYHPGPLPACDKHLAVGGRRSHVVPMRQSPTLAALAVLLAASLAGCGTAAAPPPPARPPAGLTWGGYLHGEDLRQDCRAGTTDRYRMVFNGVRPGEPVRVFDLAGLPEAGGVFEARELAVPSVAAIGPGDPFTAWRGHVHRLDLTAAQFQAVVLHLALGGAFRGEASRLDLSASRLRWFATGCHGGFYFLAAYTAGPGQADEVGLRPGAGLRPAGPVLAVVRTDRSASPAAAGPPRACPAGRWPDR